MKELQEVESNVLFHIYQICYLNSQGVEHYLRFLKSIVNAPDNILQPFVVTVLLKISRIYGDLAIDTLKLAILRKILEDEYKTNCFWLRSAIPGTMDIEHVLEAVIKNR